METEPYDPTEIKSHRLTMLLNFRLYKDPND